jgi:hypothetical protein
MWVKGRLQWELWYEAGRWTGFVWEARRGGAMLQFWLSDLNCRWDNSTEQEGEAWRKLLPRSTSHQLRVMKGVAQ